MSSGTAGNIPIFPGAWPERLKRTGGKHMMGGVKRKIRCAGRPMTAIVLAGGRGRRMKADKAGLVVGGKTLLERVLAQIVPYFDEVLVGISPGQKLSPLSAPWVSRLSRQDTSVQAPRSALRVIEDETPERGLRRRRLRYPGYRHRPDPVARAGGGGRGDRGLGRPHRSPRAALRDLPQVGRSGDRVAPRRRRAQHPSSL
ncbi:MAG: 2-C-methyl-D-erythritol 4-phosphate cytidylyltransferase [Candidatus Aminicenantes bacterium]|nr:2-C-methyl-D-erythritol 4-phosphate cytidylyltransferase [Candidatus Aminicenantes bacterium]